MVYKAIEIQGGLNKIIKPGDVVILKVNLVSDVNRSGTGEVTDVRIVKSAIKIINEITNGNVEIIVAEGTPRTDYDPSSDGTKNVWKVSGYKDLLNDADLRGINFKLINLNGPISELMEAEIPQNKIAATPFNGKFYVHKKVIEADVYKSIPVLKINIGIPPVYYYGYNKTSGKDKNGSPTPSKLLHSARFAVFWTEYEIVDLSTIANIDII